MADNAHKIERIVYDANFSSERHAYEFQANVTSFIENDIVSVIDDVCNELDRKGEVVCIDKLELDLGVVDYKNHENEIKEKLRQEFYKALSEKIAEVGRTPSENEKIIIQSLSEYKALVYFLQTGTLPWNYRKGANSKIDDFLGKALKDNAREMIAWLKQFGKDQNIRKRIVNQFNDPAIKEIVKTVDPVHAQFISDYSLDLQQTNKKEAAVDIPETEFRCLTWDVILSYILSDRGSRFNKKAFIEYTLRKMATSQSLAYYELLKVFSLSVTKLFKQHFYKTEFPEIIVELAQECDEVLNEEDATVNNEDVAKKDYLNKFRDILEGKTGDLKSNIFESLISRYPNDFLGLLNNYIDEENARISLVNVLSEKQVKQIITLNEGVESAFIIDFADRLDNNYEKHKFDQSKSNFKKVKWQLILSSLYEDRGSSFNQKEFTKDMIRKLAAHYNVGIKELTQTLYSAFSEVSKSYSDNRILADVLNDLREDYSIEDQKRQIPDYEIQEFLHIRDIYDELIFYLHHGYFRLDIKKEFKLESASSLLEFLLKKDQKLATRFYSYIQKPGNVNALLDNTSEDFMQSVIGLIMKLTFASDEDSVRTFTKTVKWYGISVIDKSIFYAGIINLLYSGKEINFRKLISNINESCSGIIDDDNRNPFSYFTVKSYLIAYLNGEKKLGIFNKSYEATWLYLSRHYKNRLGELIKSIISDTWLFDSFLNMTSDFIFLLILKDTTHSLLITDFVQYISEVSGLNRQYKLANYRKRYWTNVFLILYKYENKQDISLKEKLLEEFLNKLDSKDEKQKLISDLKARLYYFGSVERKEISKAIELVEVKSGNFDKAETAKQQIRQRALLLLQGQDGGNGTDPELFDVIASLLKEKPNEISDLLIKLLYQKDVRAFWVKNFPEYLLRKMLFILSPQEIIKICKISEIVWNAFSSLKDKQLYALKSSGKWYYIFEVLVNNTSIKFSSSFILQMMMDVDIYNKKAFLNDLNREVDSKSKNVYDETQVEIVYAIKKIGHDINEGEKNRNSNIKESPVSSDKLIEEKENDIWETIYIHNAGMVLAAPYIPMLFKRLELVGNNQFVDRKTAERSVHLLQFMIDESTASPEYLLLLNKILCGIKTGVPILREIDITGKEKETIAQLLEGMIHNWKAIGNTSVSGFRESFLNRDGILNLKDDCWELKVESKTFDMLLDQIPWSFSTIKYPWMDKVLYVKWR